MKATLCSPVISRRNHPTANKTPHPEAKLCMALIWALLTVALLAQSNPSMSPDKSVRIAIRLMPKDKSFSLWKRALVESFCFPLRRLHPDNRLSWWGNDPTRSS